MTTFPGGVEEDAVFGLFVDFDLRMVRPHVALGAGRRQAGQFDGGSVTGVTSGAGPDGAVGVGLAVDAVATGAASLDGGLALQADERIRRPLRTTRLKLLAERDLLRGEALLSVDSGPGRRGVPAVQKLLILLIVTTPAVGGRHRFRDLEAVMVHLVLMFRRLVAVEATDTFLGVHAQFVLMDDGVLLLGVAFGALARRSGLKWSARGLLGIRAPDGSG